MATYITLVDFTPQGLSNIKDSPNRAAAFAEEAGKLGATVKDLYWTSGEHDGLFIFDAPDEQTASAIVLSLARKGNVHTKTLRAFDRDEMKAILSKTQ